MNIVAIVQARMGSRRLPGKVLKEVVGKPVLWHIVDRLRHARLVDRVVIAAPDTEADRPIIDFAHANGIDYYAGSEADLLDRIYQAAKKFRADVVVWITADCPLIDPEVVDTTVRFYLDNRDKFDIVSTGKPRQPRPVPDGLDTAVIPFASLERMWREVPLGSQWREWFVAYFSELPEQYRYGTLPLTQDLTCLRWTLDHEEDLVFIREIYQRLYREDKVFLMEDVLALLRHQPELGAVNRGHQKEEAYAKFLETIRGER